MHLRDGALGHVALVADGNHADVVGEAAHEVWHDAGGGVGLAAGHVFLHADGVDQVGVGSAAGLPLHKGRVRDTIHC